MTRKNFRNAAAALAMMLAAAAGPLVPEAAAQTEAMPPAGGAAAAQVPQPDAGGVNWQGAGYGAGALFGNVLYIPAKLVYAITGGLVGGGAYLVTAGNAQTANTVWRSALGGDYVLTPDMVAGKAPINFSGPTGTSPEPGASGAAGANGSASVAPLAPLAPAAGIAQPMDRGAGPAAPPAAPASLPDASIE